MKFFFAVILFSTIIPQKLIDQYIDKVMLGDISEASEKLPEYLLKYPNHDGVLYLSALLETNGMLAKDKFSQIYNADKTSKYADNSVLKVSEYYYAAGLYVQSADWLKKIPKYYSRSEHLEKSLKLFINSLVISENVDSAAYYVKVFNKQFPDINFEEVMVEIKNDYKNEPEPQLVTLNSSNTSSKQKENSIQPTSPPKKKNKNIIMKIQDLLDKVKEDIIAPINEYTIQAGAFGKRNNAEDLKRILIEGGYDSRIETINSNGIMLYIVRVGYFSTYDDAKKHQEEIYSRLALNSIVIKNE